MTLLDQLCPCADGCDACAQTGFTKPRRGDPNFRPLADEPTVRVMTSLPESLRTWLRTQPGASDSERLRLLVEAAKARRS